MKNPIDHTEILIRMSQSLEQAGINSLEAKLKVIQEELSPTYLFVGTLKNKDVARTLLALKNGKKQENFEYNLSGSPCHDVFKGTMCCYQSEAYKKFPEDKLLIKLNIQGYLGNPLLNNSGSTLGILVAAYDHEIKDIEKAKALFQIMSRLIEIDFQSVFNQSDIENIKNSVLQWKHFLESTLDNMPVVFYSKASDGKYLYINQMFLDLFDIDRNHVIGKTDQDIFSKKYAEQFRKNDLEIIRTKKSIKSEEIAENHDGVKKYYASYKFPYLNDFGEIYATGGVSIDITSEKEALNELEKERIKTMQNAKLASIGELAAGLAHEINNPLTIVQTAARLIERYAEKGEIHLIKDRIQKIISAVERTAKIIKSLRLYARDSGKEPYEKIDIGELITMSLDMVTERYRNSGIDLKTDIVKNEWIDCRPIHFSQVLINLLINAYHAIDSLSEKWIEVRVQFDPSKQKFKFSIIDSGKGIEKNITEKLFEPFFTTKQSNQGTGLGLSLSKTIVEDHGGSIYYETLGGHTAFTVEIPQTHS